MPPIPPLRKGAHRCPNDRYEANDPKLRLKGIWIPKRKFCRTIKPKRLKTGFRGNLNFVMGMKTRSTPSLRGPQFWSCEPGNLGEQIVFNSKETDVVFNSIRGNNFFVCWAMYRCSQSPCRFTRANSTVGLRTRYCHDYSLKPLKSRASHPNVR